MPRLKKKIRVRDSEATKRLLLDAVGSILRKKGFSSLRTNEIARWVGKDKKLIRYHFNGLLDLQKAYIKEKDYWTSFFERFHLDEQAKPELVQQMFTEMMQENLMLLKQDQEVQKIILWQISEDSALMRGVTEQREVEGEKLLKLTDPSFKDRSVNFRAVMALLLGGTYYLALHAGVNKSTVCNLDINTQKDCDEVLRTIDQIIGWAWNK
ncbi:TetR/AcrR family transcriptional regulator [Pedobacter nutrimenti]|jgi:AcrR family transcriptional regulator|uniref:TetR family transcriptional regulator n=1 Tax=Pedobacter nutrimenti TaxID=1241337 RepID=A0A318USW3_9SPHI|nr:TetR/AcrR family transcriptional regulator [Pedobacter nutrimenti]PYF77185.1 TetR family transcriptional regulator [Pedobacter nutrimenti]